MELVVNRETTLCNSSRALAIILFSALLSACSTHQSSQVIIEDRTGTGVGSPSVSSSPAYKTEAGSNDKQSVPVETTPQSSPTEPVYSPDVKKPVYQQQGSPVIEPKGAVLALLEQAETHHQQGRNQQALTALERAQRIDPRQPLVYLQLAQLHMDMGQAEKAKQFARKGLSLSGDDARLSQTFNSLLR